MKRRGIIIWLMAIIILTLVFVVPSPVNSFSVGIVRNISRPVLKPLISFGRNTANFFSLILEIGDLRKENQQLMADLASARVDQSKMDELGIENQNLKSQLNYSSVHPEMELVLADVIGLDPTDCFGTIMIDKGSNNGVKTGQAVVSLGVLVGKVDQVSADSSRVMLITSKDSIVQVMLQNSRTTGVLVGGISGMQIESIPLDTVVASAEKIITSGLGGKLPKGIYVGTAEEEVSIKSDIFKTYGINSPVNFSKLEYLSVVTGI